MTRDFIPFHRPSIGEEEINEVTETLRSGWLTTGPRVARFEREFAEYVDAPHALAVSSGTAALHLALAALNIGAGHEVITTPMTFCATVQAILHSGATPVLADIGPDGNIDPEQITRSITHRTRAVIPVHFAGLPCEMNAIWELATKEGIHVIEDAAHAVGARYQGRPIGARPDVRMRGSDAVAFSFYATKNLTTGEGGMLGVQDATLADAARMLALHGTSRGAWNRYTEYGGWQYQVLAQGFKYNLSDLQAALGIHQLRKLEQFIERRSRYADVYRRAFSDRDELEIPPEKTGCRHAWHLYVLRLNLDRLQIGRDDFIRELRRRGIGTSVHFIPIPLHPFFSQLPSTARWCPRAIDLYRRIVSLPLYPALSEEEVHYVARCVTGILDCFRRAHFVAQRTPVSPRPQPALRNEEGASHD